MVYVGAGELDETVDHLFSGCRVACGVWDAIGLWCKVPQFFVFSFSDVIHAIDDLPYTNKKKEILRGIIAIACWQIWKARNERVFNGLAINVVRIVSDVKSLAYLWFKSRHKEGSIDWRNWRTFDFPLM
ncbi:uncharacterized protein LOC110913908 [Helianthus annuus]|uniref:uncharacterized protein LOC110913908 n=1 Tax=Helianthus annuus TaxID=4232 RepID=UPI001652E5D0|nr:uncharacterized protein LOC110913908 [Helianthus annuus]